MRCSTTRRGGSIGLCSACDMYGVLRLRYAKPVLSFVEGLRTNVVGGMSANYVRPERSEAKSKDAIPQTIPEFGYRRHA